VKAKSHFLILFCVGIILIGSIEVGQAQIIIETDYNSRDPDVYSSAYDTTGDLVLNTASSLSSVTSDGAPLNATQPLSNINDGITSHFNIAWFQNVGVNVDTGVDFTLSTNAATGGSPGGYDITDIQVVAGWDTIYRNFTNNDYTISYTLAGDAAPFTHTLTTVAYNPDYMTSASTLVDLNITGLSNVTALRFDITSLATGDEIGDGLDGPTVNQILVYGTAVESTPEPSTWALLLSGLGFLGFAAGRRAKG